MKNHDLDTIAKKLANTLESKGLTISTAESCTGGMVGSTITALEGSSVYFLGGVISYSNEAKENLLMVDSKTLKSEGAVSSSVAEQMAKGASQKFNSDIAVSLTGIAGPGGGSPEKPVGTVWMGVSNNNKTYSKLLQLTGDRESIRIQSTFHALSELLSQAGELK